MWLYDQYSSSGYHTSIVTTFGIDFDVYENIVLARLKGAGCHNNLLITDSRMLSHALDGDVPPPKFAGRAYTVSGVSPPGVFHSKLLLQVGRHSGRFILGSANMTGAGLAGNLEIVGEVKCNAQSSGEKRLVAAAYRYLQRVSDSNKQSVRTQFDWMLARAPWLLNTAPATGIELLADGSRAALLTTGGQKGIGRQFVEAIGNVHIKRLIVVSPYWDEQLEALSYLSEALGSPELSILVDIRTEQFPGEALSKLKHARVYDRSTFQEGRFIHAKLIIAQSDEHDHLLFGSTNCTRAALGNAEFAGSNEEASLYRELPAGSVAEQLGLSGLLKSESAIDATELRQSIADDIPLDELAKGHPGSFELNYDTLRWQAPVNLSTDNAVIHLLNLDLRPIDCEITKANSSSDGYYFHLSATEARPAFAQVKFPDGTQSSIAIIAIIDGLRSEIREKQTRKTERLALQLAQETEEGLWFLEAISLLSEEDEDVKNSDPSITTFRGNRVDDGHNSGHQILSYEAFMRGRRIKTPENGVSHNSFSGTSISLVRGSLNRLLGLNVAPETLDMSDAEEAAIAAGLSKQDETSELEQIDESSYEAGNSTPGYSEEEFDQQIYRQRYELSKKTKQQLVDAVTSFNKQVKARVQDGSLDAKDTLRLRALIMIIAASGFSENTSSSKVENRTLQQVLSPGIDADGWPRLLGRVLYTLFGSSNPAIRYLWVDASHDQLSDDLMETWGTCFWAVQTILAAPMSKNDKATFQKSLNNLDQLVYVFSQLSADEMVCSQIERVIESLAKRYEERLGVQAQTVLSAHRSFVSKLFTASAEVKGEMLVG